MSEIKELTNAMLKEKLTDALVSRSTLTIVDLDTIKQAGIYVINQTGGQVLNAPLGSVRGILAVLKGSSSTIGHIYLAQDKNGLAYRINWFDTGWGAWRNFLPST